MEITAEIAHVPERYTKEMVDEMVKVYRANPTKETVELLAEKFNRSTRAIISKLSREGVYIKPPYRTKQGEIPHTKDDIVDIIAELMGEYPESLEGLEKCPKLVLRKVALALDPTSLDRFKDKN